MDRINFKINGKKYSAGGEFTVDTTLNEFVRRHAELRGTKYMCQEGGCGACVVHVRVPGAGGGEDNSFSVNSCLVSIMSCDNWDITTIEGIGNRKDGYNVIQKRLNHFFGSQCGYCSPGFLMSFYSLLHANNGHITEKDIENSFGSNMCRCTGYRPILEAFKSLAVDVSPKVLEKIKDIEDIDQHICPKSGKNCKGSCSNKELQEWCLINAQGKETSEVKPKQLTLADGKMWFKVNSIEAIFEILEKVGNNSYMLVAGNTAKGVRPIISYPKVLIDVSNINYLQSHYIDLNLVLGANMTLTETMALFKELAKSNDDFWYLQILFDHIDRVAHIPVRNIGTLAGNLVLKNKHPDFQSDIFLLLDCIGATVTLVDKNKQQTELSMTEFLETNVVGKVMTKIKLPPLSKQHKLVTFKITPREQNAHAEVNSGFLLKFDPDNQNVLNARIVYGGISPSFTHAHETEKFLVGRNIFDNNILQGALQCLVSEIHPIENPPDPSSEFRKKLAISLFYKCILKLCPQDILDSFYKSGGTTPSQDRPPVSHSYQEFDTNKKDYPLTQPLLKREGMIQCAGEAVYTDDMPTMKNEVFASFALCTVTKGQIESIDASEAMKIDGVITVFTSEDIPGVNSFIKNQAGFYNMVENEELLAADQVRYYNQPVAIVVAKTQAIADRASNFITVKYKHFSKRPLVLTIEDAIKAPKDEKRLISYDGITPTERGANVKKVIKGKFVSPMPYHYMMELHTTVVRPVDEGLEVYCSTQWMDHIQAAIAQVLNVSESSIIVNTKRCGGAFGCKITRANLAACAAALVSKKLNRPCRISMRMPDIMRAIGKRCNSRLDYEVGVDDDGEIQYMDATFYVNDGLVSNENENTYATNSLKNCYNPNRWKVDSFGTITDMPGNCYMRAPGGYEGIAAIEHIMDHISADIHKDPITVRMANYRKDDNQLPTLVPQFIERVDLKKRQDSITMFNKQNRWKKRAIRLNNMSFPSQYLGNYLALVAVYHGDGSVIVNIGGVEIGQGLFTRIAQVAAREFQVPIEKVSVLPCYNFASPNNTATGSSITTECSAYAVIRCCEQINARLAPLRAAMPTASWLDIVRAADTQGILLQANYLTSPNDPRLINYPIFGVAALEVEVDILTGMKWIVRLDIFEDAGRSINPALDVGQVEGAIIQALSSWIMEEIKFNKQTGELYTDRSWNYKIFGAKDIPHDIRVYLERGTSNPVGILGSKIVGEPPSCLGYVIVESLREAIQSSRLDSGYDVHKYLSLDIPVSNESVVKAAEVKIEEFVLY